MCALSTFLKFLVEIAMEKRSNVLNQVGPISEIRVCDEEFAFVTAAMSEKAFEEKIKKLDGVLSVIRVED